jgi:hypothetical protein
VTVTPAVAALPVANTVVLAWLDVGLDVGPAAEIVEPVKDARLVAGYGVDKAELMDDSDLVAATLSVALTVTVVVSVVRVLVTTLARMLME